LIFKSEDEKVAYTKYGVLIFLNLNDTI